MVYRENGSGFLHTFDLKGIFFLADLQSQDAFKFKFNCFSTKFPVQSTSSLLVYLYCLYKSFLKIFHSILGLIFFLFDGNLFIFFNQKDWLLSSFSSYRRPGSC